MDLDRSPRPPRRSRRLLLRTATLTVVLLSVPAAALANHLFSDVPHTHAHAKGIGYVAEVGITQGCDGSRYCPGDDVNRAQMGTFLYRASGNDPATPPSVNAARLQGQPASAFARKADLPKVRTVTESVGCTGTSFMPIHSNIQYRTFGNGRYVTNGTAPELLECQVTPPDGARLRSATFRVSDGSPDHRIHAVSVLRRPLLGNGQDLLGFAHDVTTNAGTPGGVTVTVPIASDSAALVNNGTHAYSFTVGLGPSGDAAFVMVVGAVLTYEVDRLVP